jgi:hypothetical protein
MKLIRKFRIGHLYFKYVQGTPLESSGHNTSKLLALELLKRGMIELYRENRDDLEVTTDIKQAVWYSYRTGMEPTKTELVKLLTKDAA